MKLIDVTIGADPELFIINTTTNKVVSAVGLIPGVKGKPWKPNRMRKGFGLETDNILAEFNIPPVKNCNDFINHIQTMKSYIDKYVKMKNKELGILCSASQEVPESELQSKEARMFGCDIDYNVYTQKPNEKPNGKDTNLRSAGFHIHVGYKNPNIETNLQIIKYLDAYVGLPSLLEDSDAKRRILYGKAGSFRVCPYGCEYRTLSSAMMRDEVLLRFIWDQIHKGLQALEMGKLLPTEEEVINAINNSDVELCKKLCFDYCLLL